MAENHVVFMQKPFRGTTRLTLIWILVDRGRCRMVRIWRGRRFRHFVCARARRRSRRGALRRVWQRRRFRLNPGDDVVREARGWRGPREKFHGRAFNGKSHVNDRKTIYFSPQAHYQITRGPKDTYLWIGLVSLMSCVPAIVKKCARFRNNCDPVYDFYLITGYVT